MHAGGLEGRGAGVEFVWNLSGTHRVFDAQGPHSFSIQVIPDNILHGFLFLNHMKKTLERILEIMQLDLLRSVHEKMEAQGFQGTPTPSKDALDPQP